MSTKNSELHNFADNNTITCSSSTLSQLIKDANEATDWFKMNNMIVNLEKFQAIITDRKGQNNPTEINIDAKIINCESSVLLLGLVIDSKLTLDKHISKLYNKSAGQLNALIRLNRYLGFEEKKILINSFIYGNFNYCPLVWHFCSKTSLSKIENIYWKKVMYNGNKKTQNVSSRIL